MLPFGSHQTPLYRGSRQNRLKGILMGRVTAFHALYGAYGALMNFVQQHTRSHALVDRNVMVSTEAGAGPGAIAGFLTELVRRTLTWRTPFLSRRVLTNVDTLGTKNLSMRGKDRGAA
jgi:hypothetical protein